MEIIMKSSLRKIALLCSALVVCLLALCACGKKEESSDTKNESSASSKVVESSSEVSSVVESSSLSELIDDGKHITKIGLYLPDDKTYIRKYIPSLQSNWIKGKDIACFETYYSNDPELPPTQAVKLWQSFLDKYVDSAQYKMGYYMIFTLKSGEQHSIRILKPEDTMVYRPYIETYLYDDYHQIPGHFYSHLLPSQMNEKTMTSSIKLTVGQKGDEVDNIQLTVFAYKGDADFDASTKYIGRISNTINITRK